MAPKKRKAEVDHGSRKASTCTSFTRSRFTDHHQKKAAKTPTTRRITRVMTTDAARRAVFETAELLENIVMQLPPRKIFVIQRVCKQFRDIVATSIKLQQRLFLRSDGTEAQEWRVAAKDDAEFPNSDWLRTHRFVKSTYIAEADENLGVAFKPVRLGHALEVEELEYGEPASYSYPLADQWVDFRQEMNCLGESSLAKTYLTHPPTQQVIVDLPFSYKSTRYRGRVEISGPDGLKVADIVHAIRCSEFWDIIQCRTATHEAKSFKHVSIQEITGDENFLDKTKIDWKSAAMILPDCIAPTEDEWAAMAG
ncbi:hypothetical protein KC318_g12354 [Hortaea werneckii]|uniref:F-box domain-containing protein n=1 Tax=Hortaea werneckii TaxID=91943 RepID=A0A3M6YFZ5_HORWE|nr:hypothetical protein KC334_g12869 [Hortaea werneckii]KAI7010724.1 hypothetical protein KC355_g6050 [Hortaea werneckii]KAI7656537.1 hypothetical protein KC318_g12354 [Hortaea werneckii]RMY01681.1 hypothetical protein D0866_15755 [Hortaea werneckii]